MWVVGGLKEYLESSSIHGLAYIAGTRRLVRLFWICTVAAGLSFAGYLIHDSVTGWAESPISTDIETFPIDRVKFPLVTVCPPKEFILTLLALSR